MKFILVLLLWTAVIDAGTEKLSQSEEDDIIDKYRQYCSTGESGGIDDDVQWFCKIPDEPSSSEEINTHLVVTAPPQIQKQIFFIQTSAKRYIHKISVHGDNGITKNDVTIYVIPPKHEHQVEIEGDIKVHAELNKPETTFIKKQPFSFRLPDNQPIVPTSDPKPFGQPFVAKSPDVDYGTPKPINVENGSETTKQKRHLPRAQFISVEAI